VDDTDRIVPDGQSTRDRVFALQNMNVGPADRRCRNANEGIGRPDPRDRFFLKNNSSGLDKYSRFHSAHHFLSLVRYVR
jgi:hypothetical protein